MFLFPDPLKRWLYRGDRPHRVAKLLNRGWAKVGSAGRGPKHMAALEVRGRRSGRPRSFPVMVADYEGERYLVPMLGERANWVANVRAAGGRAVLHHAGDEAIRLEEVDEQDRAPILKRYLEIAPGARPHIPVDRRAPLPEFERIAGRYPVFRICPDPDPAA
jgi:deazaflavin-dependent oxidoreductase (nitroreductase family)